MFLNYKMKSLLIVEGVKMKINEKINIFRDELNYLISINANYYEIYKLSIYIDSLILEYYREIKKNKSS
ncbi:Spo0E family sporulation regulatory protein-aspartic acid phosphatase [Senegalia massiliensis]|uniref:Spo0E family sporulation regulatory protein-aspartic acid phosphatase n=2 Tax=Senegalia massiliensis TaxID=1720316 RepID=A0A845QW77_9CLOT|nr:Spo0E family sporulation regulatory protein-aspartic acid phosphatase [Senegalia massiliensis]